MGESTILPLEALYGADALDKVTELIMELKKDSNIPFTFDYVQTGISFININANSIHTGKLTKMSLKALVTMSFGEAAISHFDSQRGRKNETIL